WLAPQGPDSDVAVSCRVRLARNVRGYPFVSRLEQKRAEELCERLRSDLAEAAIDGETIWVPIAEASPLVRVLLRERHLVSRDMVPNDDGARAPAGRGVAFGASETVAVMVNEEDHLRLQAMASGYQLEEAWQRALGIDRYLEGRIEMATSSELGYL